MCVAPSWRRVNVRSPNFIFLSHHIRTTGFAHSAFTFAYESQITKSSVANAQVSPLVVPTTDSIPRPLEIILKYRVVAVFVVRMSSSM